MICTNGILRIGFFIVTIGHQFFDLSTFLSRSIQFVFVFSLKTFKFRFITLISIQVTIDGQL